MNVSLGGVRVHISFLFCVVLCLIVLFDNGAVLPAFIAVCAHESAHLLAMLLCGVPVEGVSLEAFGILIERGECAESFAQKTGIAAAGCCMNLGLFLLSFFGGNLFLNKLILQFAAVNALLLFVNILPVKGLDGADLLSLFLERCFPHKNGERIGKTVSIATCIILFLFGVIICLKVRVNPSICLFSLFLLVQSFAKPAYKD